MDINELDSFADQVISQKRDLENISKTKDEKEEELKQVFFKRFKKTINLIFKLRKEGFLDKNISFGNFTINFYTTKKEKEPHAYISISKKIPIEGFLSFFRKYKETRGNFMKIDPIKELEGENELKKSYSDICFFENYDIDNSYELFAEFEKEFCKNIRDEIEKEWAKIMDKTVAKKKKISSIENSIKRLEALAV